MKFTFLSLALALFITSGCSSFFTRNPASVGQQKHKHYIMTLHGVRGNAVSFGDFHDLIKMHLEQIDPNYEVVNLNITYPVGMKWLGAHAAAADINRQLDEKIKNLDPADKFSVLAYSMGGQIGMTWYYDSLKDEAHKKYPLQVSKFFSLGAAYWGSKEAALGTNVDNIFGQLDATEALMAKYKNLNKIIDPKKLAGEVESIRSVIRQKVANFGTTYDKNILQYSNISFSELINLSLASDEINENRLANINVKNNTRWISLSSLVSCFKPDLLADEPGCENFQNKLFADMQADIFGKYTFGLDRRETDNSVITPSANANFIYAVETAENYEPGHVTLANNFRYSIPQDQQRFILAEGLHATVVPASYYEKAQEFLGLGGASWKGLADDVVLVYKSDCAFPDKNPEKCKHPAYKFIVQEFADCEHSSCDPAAVARIITPLFKAQDKTAQQILRKDLHGFVLELNLRVPKNYDLSSISHKNIFNNIQVKFADKASHLIKSNSGNYDVILARPEELGALLVNKVTHFSNQNQLRVAMMGLVVAKQGKPYDFAELEKGTPVEFTVNLPGLKHRQVQAVVRPYFTTYADLMLAK